MSDLLELLVLASPDFPNALCPSVNPELMTPDTRAGTKFGKSLCCKCVHKSECLEIGIRNHEVGVWGGTDDDQREAMRGARARIGMDISKPKRAHKIVGSCVRKMRANTSVAK